MAPGSSIFEEFPDSQLMDCETTIDFDNAHSFKTSPTSDIKTRISVHELLECPVCTNSMYPPIHQVFNCFGQHFCLHLEAFLQGKAPVYTAFLCFMSENNVAKNFSYSLEVGGNGRKLMWQGVPRSIRDDHRKVGAATMV